MKKVLLVFTLLLNLAEVSQMSAQANLVLNPSFEQVNGCPEGQSSTFLDSAEYWYNPTSNSVDLFLSCTSNSAFNHVPNNAWGNQIPNTGQNYAGVCADYRDPNFSQRDYVGGTLSDTLTQGKLYIVSLYINSSHRYASHFSGLGVYFSDTLPVKKYDPFPIIFYERLPFTPQVVFDTMVTDTNSWVQLIDTLTAGGGKSILSLGYLAITILQHLTLFIMILQINLQLHIIMSMTYQ